MLLQIDPSLKVPGAIDSLLQTSAIFAIMSVIVVAVVYAGWTILNRHLKHLEKESDKTKVLDEIEERLKGIDHSLNKIKEELIRGGRRQ